MFYKRLLSGIVLLLLATILFYVGGLPLLIAVGIISIIGQRELYKALGIDHKFIAFIGYLMTVVYYTLLYLDGTKYMAGMIVGFLMVFMTAYVVTFPEYKTEEITAAFFGMCYVSVLMSYIYLTRSFDDGRIYVWLILISAWGEDTLAYCAGRLFGKHKMASKLSPKKTIEGAIGGILGAGLLGFLYGFLLKSHMPNTLFPKLVCAFSCVVGAVIAIIGDLAASAIKRNHDIKDFGSIIPGHGGILDRFDSMLFTAPAIFYAILLLEKFL